MPTRGRLYDQGDRVVREYYFQPSSKPRLCCKRPLELVLVPLLTLSSVLVNIICICGRTWMNGYLHIGTHFVQLSPWYICASPCPGGSCPNYWVRGEPSSHQVPKTSLDCFWMNDWTGTDFGKFTAVQQLEYWCLAASILATGFSLVLCMDTRGRICTPYCNRAAAALLLVSVCLSVSAVVVFATSVEPGVMQLADGRPVLVSYSWIFYFRCCSSAISVASLLCTGIHWWRTKTASYYTYDDDDDRMTIVSLNADDMDEQWSELGEHL